MKLNLIQVETFKTTLSIETDLFHNIPLNAEMLGRVLVRAWLRWWERPHDVYLCLTAVKTYPPINTQVPPPRSHTSRLAAGEPPPLRRSSIPASSARPAVGHIPSGAPNRGSLKLEPRLKPRMDYKEAVHGNMASKVIEHLNLSEEQIAVLEDNFKKLSRHPDGTTLMLIAAECNLTEEETKVSKYVIGVCVCV